MEPKIRLKGYSKEWQQVRLGEIGSFKSAGVDKKINANESMINLLNYMDVYNKKDINASNCNELMHVSATSKQIQECNVLKGDIFFTPTSETAEDIGHVMTIEEDLPNTCYSYHLMRFRPQKDVFYGSFPNYGLESDYIRKQMVLAAKGVQRMVIGKSDFDALSVYLPTINEQKDISKFFNNLNALIKACNQKIESLKQVKVASLQSMFPQEGETSPRVRFKGFEGEWNVVTLGEVGTFKSNGVDKLVRPDEKMINLLNYLDVYNSRQINKENCNSLMQVSASDRQIIECDVQKNDIFFTPSSETAEDIGYVLVMKDTLPNTCYSYHLMRYRPNEGVFFEDFPNYGFTTKYVREQMRLLAKGVQRFVIGKTEFESIKVQIPSYQEQKKIADYFRSLDSQIIGQTQRLDKLKQIKSACLDNMFV